MRYLFVTDATHQEFFYSPYIPLQVPGPVQANPITIHDILFPDVFPDGEWPVLFEFRYHVFDSAGKELKFPNKICEFYKLKDSNVLTLNVNINNKFVPVKTSEIDKDILHVLYMYLLEHNEEHLNCLERLK